MTPTVMFFCGLTLDAKRRILIVRKKLFIYDMEKFNKKALMRDALKKATPIARKFVVNRVSAGVKFDDIEDDFITIIRAEESLYEPMKEALVSHIRRHGLDVKSLELLDEFISVEYFNKDTYNQVLKKVRKSFVSAQKKVAEIEKQLSADATNSKALKAELRRFEVMRNNFEYLNLKITEYLQKIDNLSDALYDMLASGKLPDFEAWRDKQIIQDNLFEENKQFLKQSLNHLKALKRNNCKLGMAELRLLFYNKQGCHSMALYREAERWIVDIFYSIDSPEDRQEAYKEICSFVSEVVPVAGSISPYIISFIFDNDYLSEMSRDLLIKIQPVISKLGMTALIMMPLKKFYAAALERLKQNNLTESDQYVLQVMQLYNPKSISPDVLQAWKVV